MGFNWCICKTCCGFCRPQTITYSWPWTWIGPGARFWPCIHNLTKKKYLDFCFIVCTLYICKIKKKIKKVVRVTWGALANQSQGEGGVTIWTLTFIPVVFVPKCPINLACVHRLRDLQLQLSRATFLKCHVNMNLLSMHYSLDWSLFIFKSCISVPLERKAVFAHGNKSHVNECKYKQSSVDSGPNQRPLKSIQFDLNHPGSHFCVSEQKVKDFFLKPHPPTSLC